MKIFALGEIPVVFYFLFINRFSLLTRLPHLWERKLNRKVLTCAFYFLKLKASFLQLAFFEQLMLFS